MSDSDKRLRSDAIEDILASVLERLDSGESLEALLENYPEQAGVLRRRLQHLAWLDSCTHGTKRVGEFQLIRLLGKGGMAEVWLAS